MTRGRLIQIHEVLVHLGLDDDRLLRQLREEGLFEADEIDPRGADEFRLAALMMTDLGVNPAGVHVALHLRRRLIALEARASAMMRSLQEEEDRNHVD
jgi:hydroxylamine reductase (hybrid-cluster protein)